MDVLTAMVDSTRVLQLRGDLDAKTVHHIDQDFPESLWADDSQVAIDLSQVNFIDSSGVGLLVFLVKRLWARQRSVCLVGLHGQPARLITMLRISQTVPCFDCLPSELINEPGFARLSNARSS